MGEKKTKKPAATDTATAGEASKKTTPFNKTPEQRAEDKQKRESALAKDHFVRVMGPDGKTGIAPTKKLPPQAQTIVNVIETCGKAGCTRAELVEKLKGVLTTKQPESRILSYYQKLIQEEGTVKVVIHQPEAAAAPAK